MTNEEQLILKSINEKALQVLDEPKMLASGRESYIFADMPRAVENYRARAALAGYMGDKYSTREDLAVCGIASGGIALARGMADHMRAPQGYIKKDEDEVDGMEVKGLNIIMVEDVTTTAGSLLKGARKVVAQGGRIAGISVVLDRSFGELDYQYAQLKALYPDSYSGKCHTFCTLEDLNISPVVLAHEELSFKTWLKNQA